MLIFTQLQSWAARCLFGGHRLFEMIVVEISVFCLQAQGLLFLTIPRPMLALFIDSRYDPTCTSSSAGQLTSSQLRTLSSCHRSETFYHRLPFRNCKINREDFISAGHREGRTSRVVSPQMVLEFGFCNTVKLKLTVAFRYPTDFNNFLWIH